MPQTWVRETVKVRVRVRVRETVKVRVMWVRFWLGWRCQSLMYKLGYDQDRGLVSI